MPVEPPAHRNRTRLQRFVAAVMMAGGAAIVYSALHVSPQSITVYTVALCVLTIATGRFAIKVPGQAATVSVSEVFVFALILLAGPTLPVLTVALDGLWTSLRQRRRRLDRTLFNIAEPAISTWAAAHAFLALNGGGVGAALGPPTAALVPATVAMAGVFFALNSGLNAVAVALESGGSAYRIWRSHAWYLAINYDAAASLAALCVAGPSTINFGVVGLALPLLILSYVAYREASVREDESRRHVTDIEGLYRASVEMLAIAVDAKDQITHGHIRRVQRHTLAVARSLGIEDAAELKAIEAGALLHDIGKLGIPDYVLNKPSALTPAEFETMKRHATMGARILTAVSFPYPIVPIVRHHHERWDGRGYPDGLCGSEIPLGARILAVVDCFDALTSDRPYRARMTDAQAIALLRSRSGSFYEPKVVEQFIALIPLLRHDDEVAGERQDLHASVVAGLAKPSIGGAVDNDPADGRSSAERIPSSLRDRIDDHVRRNTGLDVALFVPDANGEALAIAYATAPVRRALADVTIPIASGVSGWVAANRSTIRKADAALDLGSKGAQLGFNDCASVPIFVRGDLFGVLTVYAASVDNPEETAAAIGLLAQEIGLLIAKSVQSSALARVRAADGLAAVS